MTQSVSDREYAEQREADVALDRARGHVQEVRRLWEQGGRFGDALPYLDQLEADLNTLRPQHVGQFSALDGAPLYGDGTRATGAQAAEYQSRVEPGSMASQPMTVGEGGIQYPDDRQPITERDEEIKDVQAQRAEDGGDGETSESTSSKSKTSKSSK
jgi:hypothetical protein